MKLFFKKENFYLISLVLIILLSAYLRLHDLPKLFVFTADEEYQTTLAKTIVNDFHIIWIGVSAANLNFYLGPFWTYFTSFWLFVSKGDPLITGYISSLIGVLTTALIFVTGLRLFNRKVGLMASLLYACLPLLVYFDQKYWNPSLVPFLSLLMILAIYETRHTDKWWIVFTIAFGLVFHVHLSLVPLGLLALYILLKNKNITKMTLAYSAIAFIITISPLIAFDYFHKFSNITVPLRINQITATETTRVNPLQHAIAFYDVMGRLFYLKPFRTNSDEILFACTSTSEYKSSKLIDQYSSWSKPILPISLLSLSIFGIFLLRKKTWSQENSRLLALFLLIILISFLFFPGLASEYYLLGFYPLFLLVPGVLIESIRNPYRYLLLIPLVFVCLAGITTILTAKGDFGIQTQKNIINKVTQVIDNNPFDLQEAGLCHKYEGWRYLYTVYGKKPERSSADKSLGWLYPNDISSIPTKYSVIMSEARVPVNFSTTNSMKISEGGFDAYIYKNR